MAAANPYAQYVVDPRSQAAPANVNPYAQYATPDDGSTTTPDATPAAPAAADVPLGQSVADYLRGIKLGLYDIPQSVAEWGARGLDATGLTKDAYKNTKGALDDMNAIYDPDLNNNGGNRYTKGGRVVGNVIATAPTMAIAPVAGEGVVPAIANGMAQGFTTSALTSGGSDHPLQDIVLGTGAGGLFGSGAHLLMRGIAKGIAPSVSAADDGLSYVRSLLSGSKAPDAPALRAAQATAGNKPITAAEAIGQQAEAGVGALARRPGETGDALTAAMAARQDAAPGRMLGDYAAASGIDPASAQGNFDKLIAGQQQKTAPLYKEAFDANQNVSSPEIDSILATPAGRKALNSAAENMQNDRVLMGVRDPDLLEQAREGGTEIPWQGGVASGLKLRSLDYVKRALDGQINVALKAGNTDASGPLIGLKNDFVKALDAADTTAQAGPNSVKPEGGLYAQARKSAGSYLSAQQEFENGGNMVLNPNVTTAQFTAHLGDLGDADSQAFKGGIANKLFNMAQNSRLGTKIFKVPAVQQKLTAALGPENAATFLANMEKEGQMASFAAKRTPGTGSLNMEHGAAAAAQDGNNGWAQDLISFGANAAHQGVLPATGALAMSKAKDIAARVLTSGMSEPVRDASGRLLMGSPNDLADALDRAAQAQQMPGLFGRRAALALGLRRNINHVAPAIGGILAAPAVNNSVQ